MSITEEETIYATQRVEILKANLWYEVDQDIGVWALLDGQWADGLVERLISSDAEFCSLHEGPIDYERVANSPYLVRLQQNSPFTEWLLKTGWSNGWGFFFQASASAVTEAYPAFDAKHVLRRRNVGEFFGSRSVEEEPHLTTLRLRRHFRKFSRVHLYPDNKLVAFRFFDPATLRIYLDNATVNELAAFFGPIRFIICEDFSEIVSLNCPDSMIVFTLIRGPSGDIKHLRSKILNLKQMEIVDPTLSPNYISVTPRDDLASSPPPFKQTSPYSLIGAVHIDAFERAEAKKFREGIAAALVGSDFGEGILDINEARATVSTHLARGEAFGLAAKTDLTNFVTCSLRHAPNFPEGYEHAMAIFGVSGSMEPSDKEIISKRLSRWAAQDIKGVIE